MSRVDLMALLVPQAMQPQDGTPPFHPHARCDNDGYDSDDEWTTSPDILDGFNLDTGLQNLKPISVPDNRLLMPRYQPPPSPTTMARRGFTVKDADTVISLSADPEDLLLLRSDLLKKSHAFFEASFSRWSSNQLATPVPAGDFTAETILAEDTGKFPCMVVDYSREESHAKRLKQMVSFVEAAKRLIEDDFTTIPESTDSSKFWVWNLEATMDFNEYIYPWQVFAREPTDFTHFIDGPAL